MVFNAAFNSISVISRQKLTLFMLSWVSPVLRWALKCLAQGHSHEKTQRIQCGSNPGPLDYELNTLPLSHFGPLIEEDARYTMQEIEELSGIHSSSVLKILCERLGLRKICARWVPHLLTDEQKQSRVKLASQVIEKYDKCDPRRLKEIVTGDET